MKSTSDSKNTDYPEGPGWSPHGGYFWYKAGKTYWPNGEISDGPPITRFDSGLPYTQEDYSAWSDDKRAEVKAKFAKEYAEREAKRQAWQKEQDTLVTSAKAKLTPEEFEAILLEGRDS